MNFTPFSKQTEGSYKGCVVDRKMKLEDIEQKKKIDEKRTNGLVGNITNDCNNNKCVWGNEEISTESHKTDEDSGKNQ